MATFELDQEKKEAQAAQKIKYCFKQMDPDYYQYEQLNWSLLPAADNHKFSAAVETYHWIPDSKATKRLHRMYTSEHEGGNEGRGCLCRPCVSRM